MPELPDITIYVEALQRRILNQALQKVRITSPFLLRTATPPIQSLEGRRITSLRRMGKRIVFGLEGDLWLVLHLMIAGRLHWRKSAPTLPMNLVGDDVRSLALSSRQKLETPHVVSYGSSRRGAQQVRGGLSSKHTLASFAFADGILVLTEAGTKQRASLHLLPGEAALRALDPGGLEVSGCSLDEFARTLTKWNHTLKRALTDPHLFSGIGNAYSDEILHGAKLSPIALTSRLSPPEIERLWRNTQATLTRWTELLRKETGDEFPEHVTAFRTEMAVHGKFGQPCPECGAKVQRIRYASNETNYCPGCQTGGKLLADRSLSLLLKKDWPKTPEELEAMRGKERRR